MSDEAGIVKCGIDYDSTLPTSTLHQYLTEKLSQHPGDGIAMVNYVTKSQWTFEKILNSARTLSATLQADFGLLKGQVVALALSNSAEFFVSLLAVSRCGGVSSFVNPSYTTLELENVVIAARPALWICSPEVLPQLDKISTKDLYRAIVVDVAQSSSETDAYNNDDSHIRPWDSVMSSFRPEEEFNEPSFDVQQDLVAIPFSSGTTGMPKAVMLTHHNLITAFCSFMEGCCVMDKNDVFFGLLPFYHVYGCLMTSICLIVGARIINFQKFSFIGMLEAVQEHKISVMPLVPPVAALLSKLPIVDNYDLSSVKYFFNAAAPLSQEVLGKLIHKFGWEFKQGFGMTECVVTHVSPRGENMNLLGKNGSIGVLMPFIEAKIVDQETSKVALIGPGKVGELCIRSSMVMKGYQGNPTATAEAIDSDGWLHTGDLAYYDDDGWFFIVGRLKELIKFKGNQVAPTELEHIILQHPDVVDAAVVGIPDDIAGELPKAYVVKRAGSSVTEEEVAKFLHDQVSSFKHLRGGLVFISEIPKSTSGKILRKQLVDF